MDKKGFVTDYLGLNELSDELVCRSRFGSFRFEMTIWGPMRCCDAFPYWSTVRGIDA